MGGEGALRNAESEMKKNTKIVEKINIMLTLKLRKRKKTTKGVGSSVSDPNPCKSVLIWITEIKNGAQIGK